MTCGTDSGLSGMRTCFGLVLALASFELNTTAEESRRSWSRPAPPRTALVDVIWTVSARIT